MHVRYMYAAGRGAAPPRRVAALHLTDRHGAEITIYADYYHILHIIHQISIMIYAILYIY